jgi:sensor histidine kinase YesM
MVKDITINNSYLYFRTPVLMGIADLILSNKPSHRFVRHLVFWIVYCTYFFVQSLAPRQLAEFRNSDTYYFAFLNVCCFGPVFIFAVYFSIYYLLPKSLAGKKYLLFLFGFLLLYAAGTIINYFMAGIFLSQVHYSTPVENNFQHRIEFGNYNTRWGMVIAMVAIGIRLTKTWYLQQKENLEIQKKNNRAEMQLQKARLHPAFLFRSLDTIFDHIQSGSAKAPSIILNLSELLSYSLYENGKKLVPLERELEQLTNFIALEHQDSEIDIKIQAQCKANTKYLVPLILIKLLEESVALLHTSEQIACLTKLHVAEHDNQLSVMLVFQQWQLQQPTINWPVAIESAKKRLLEYYSKDDFGITLIENGQETIISLHLTLRDDPWGLNTVYKLYTKAAYDGI